MTHRLRCAAIYARISSEKQSELSPASQVRKCREAAEARHFRGLDERALRRLHTGGRCYGYSSVEAEGGKRLMVSDAEAQVVRRIFADYVEGRSLRTIAKTLNGERVAPPQARPDRIGAGWCQTAIREMLRNERYIGRVVWNRSQFIKAPGTNRRVARPRPMLDWRIVEIPEQRIVSDDLWNGVQARLAWMAKTFGNGRPGLLTRNASSRYLFSGLLYCAACGGRMVIFTGHGKNRHARYGCSGNFYRGTCLNNLRERQDKLEEHLLQGLQGSVLQPEVVVYTLQQFERELGRRFQAMPNEIDSLRERKAEIEIELRNLTDTAACTGPSTFLVQRIAEREQELQEISARLLNRGSDSVVANLANLRKFALSRLADLRRLLYSDVERARMELCRHVNRIELRPVVEGKQRHYIAAGEWDLLGTRAGRTLRNALGGGFGMVAGACNHPNWLVLPFCFELIRSAA